jgi:hypothetical protein
MNLAQTWRGWNAPSRWSIRAAVSTCSLECSPEHSAGWVAWSLWSPLSTLNPIYIHLLVVGWLTQLIYGVIYWMFPIISKDNPRGDLRLAWAVFITLNAGLLFRIAGEPWRAVSPNAINSALLVASSIIQIIAGYLFVVVAWPRIREKMGR